MEIISFEAAHVPIVIDMQNNEYIRLVKSHPKPKLVNLPCILLATS